MVRGLNVFRERFAGFQDRYVLIGGAAVEVAMDAAALRFRVTSIWLTRITVLKVRKRLPKSGGQTGDARPESNSVACERVAKPASAVVAVVKRKLRRLMVIACLSFGARRLAVAFHNAWVGV